MNKVAHIHLSTYLVKRADHFSNVEQLQRLIKDDTFRRVIPFNGGRSDKATQDLKAAIESVYPRAGMMAAGGVTGAVPGAVLGGGVGALIQALRRADSPADMPNDKKPSLGRGLGWGALAGGALGAGAGALTGAATRADIEHQILG